ncbi:MAG: sulfatase [Cyclobacteriaceae bacterium]|nr:sulfatase [Cyclobacteriaceae bacterium]
MRWTVGCLICVLLLLINCQNSTTPVAQVEEKWPEKPNILWLVAEDLGPYIPAFGDSTIVTPNLDRLAREGIVYPQVYSPSGVCAPSRFAIATGMYPNRGGGHHMRTGPWYRRWSDEELGQANTSRPQDLTIYEALPPGQVKMHSEYLRRAGYYCTNNAKQDYQFRAPLTAWDESSPDAHWRNRAPGQPFFAIFNFGITHESQIWARSQDSLWVDPQLPVPVPPYLPDNAVGRKDVRRMYSNIKIMDQQVGQVLDELEADGLLEHTVIFWYTDHGGPLPRQKRLLYDSGIRLPLIVRLPEKWRAGTTDRQMVSFVDFKPTIMALAGLQLPEYLDGRPFLGTASQASPRKYIHAAADRFDEKYDMIRAVRDRKFKYLRNYQPEKGYYLAVAYREQMPVMQELLRLQKLDSLDQFQKQWFRPQKVEEELFDCENDPHELHNLALDPRYSEKLQELRAECDRWMQEITDLGLQNEEEMIASWWPQGVQPQTSTPEISISGQPKTGLLKCNTEGASIGYRFSTNEHWQIYQEPIALPDTGSIQVIAHRIGFKESTTAELSF